MLTSSSSGSRVARPHIEEGRLADRTQAASEAGHSEAIHWIGGTALLCLAINLLFSRYLFWDSYLDLSGGRYISQHGIPHREVFTVAARGRVWIDQQWLAHLLYYDAWRLAGYAAVAVLSSLLVAGAFCGLAALLVRRGVPPQRAAMWTILAYVACMGNTVIRAQSFAYPLFVLVLWLFLADADSRRFDWRFVLLLPALALWSNLHGTVLLAAVLVSGHGLVSVWTTARARDARSALLYGAVAASAPFMIFANPYGFSVLNYFRSLIGNSVIREHIVEWAPPSFGYTSSLPFIFLLLVIVGGLGYAFGRGYRPPLMLSLIVAVLFALATQGVRYQAWFAIAGTVLVAEALARVRNAPPPLASRLRRLAALTVAIFAAIAMVEVTTTSSAQFERLAPRAALAAASSYAASHPASRVLADDVSSSALLWLYPETIGRVAFDARLEEPPRGELRRWFDFMQVGSPEWFAVAHGYDVIVASMKQNPKLVEHARQQPGWRVLYENDDGVVLVRRAAA